MRARIIDLDPVQPKSATAGLAAILLALAIGGAGGYGLGFGAAAAAQVAPAPIIMDAGRTELITQLLDQRIHTCDEPARASMQVEYCVGVGDWR